MKTPRILVVLASMILFGCSNTTAPVDAPTASDESASTEVVETPSEVTEVAISEVATIADRYVVNGTNPDGSQYVGQVIVEESDDGSIGLYWTINQDTWTGIGEITDDGKLYVRYEGGFSGDGTWTLMSDGSLSGEWQADGGDQSGTEVWKKN